MVNNVLKLRTKEWVIKATYSVAIGPHSSQLPCVQLFLIKYIHATWCISVVADAVLIQTLMSHS